MVCELAKKTNSISALLVKSVLNVLKSVVFNLLMLSLGFGLGYYAFSLKVDYVATHSDGEYVLKLLRYVLLLIEMDKDYANKLQEILLLLNNFKCKLSLEAQDKQ